MTNRKTKDLNRRITLKEAYDYSGEYVNDLLKKNHGILGQVMEHLAKAQGKGVRAALLLQSAVGEDELVPIDACKAAAAIELFHLATLVHDDVIDDADTRRGIQSVQRKFGKKEAVIVGDYLLCLSFSTITSIDRNSFQEEHMDLLTTFVNMGAKICTGEYNQLVHNYNTSIDYKDYYKTITGKTAALFWISSYLGAALAGESQKQAKIIAKFGQLVGVIFQIMDDCKDYEMTEEEALKPVKSDLKEGVITLPLILAMARDESLRLDVKRVFDGSLEVVKIIEQVKQSEGLIDAQNLSGKYFKKATKLLNSLENEVKKSVLLDSLNRIFPTLAV